MVASVPGRPRDLDNRTQVHNLVIHFYREIAFDDLLGPVFSEVAEVDWSVHIPKLIDYWCRVLLGEPGYDGLILAPHRHVHELESFRPELFDRWYGLFVESIDQAWQGPIADRAKAHAARMARTLARRLLDLEWTAPDQAFEPVEARRHG
jgi:hemoglobin